MTVVIDLDPFCMPPDEESRLKLNSPFVLGGYRYAADGAIAVRVDAACEPDTPDDVRIPRDIVSKFAKIELTGESVACPSFVSPDDSDKWLRTNMPCDECDGAGDCDCDCPHCDNDCFECGGRGSITAVPGHWYEPMTIGNRQFAKQYLWRVSQLPNAKLWPDAKSWEDSMPFSFDGGVGLLMPLRDDEVLPIR